MAIPLASIVSWTVLLEMVSLASAPMLESAQVAMPSSPVLRMSLLVTVELVTPPWKLMPSAVVSRMRMPLTARRDPHGAAGAGRADGGVERAGGIVGAGGVGALAGHRDRAGGLGQRRADLLEVGEVDRVGRGGVPGVDLQLERRAGWIGAGEQ